MADRCFVVLLDAGFLKYTLKQKKDDPPITAELIERFIHSIGKLPALEGASLHRVYFCDARPLTGKVKKPDGTMLDFTSTEMTKVSSHQHTSVARLPGTARLPETRKRGPTRRAPELSSRLPRNENDRPRAGNPGRPVGMMRNISSRCGGRRAKSHRWGVAFRSDGVTVVAGLVLLQGSGGEPAIDVDDRAGDECGLRACEKDDRGRDFVDIRVASDGVRFHDDRRKLSL